MKNVTKSIAPLNLFERIIAKVSPKWAVSRSVNRFRLDQARKFEGAAKGRRADGWKVDSTSPDRELLPVISLLRDRSRDFVRNNPYAKNAVDVLVTNTIGTGIMPTPATKDTKLKDRVLDVWKAWAETKACDFNGELNFYGLEELALKSMFESGEVFIRKRYTTLKNAIGQKQIPIQLQIIECDLLDPTKNQPELPNGGKLVAGKEFDADGRVVAYWMYKVHPSEALGGLISVRIDASEIIHIYHKTRPGQTRGVPAGVSSFLRLRDIDDYEDAQIMRQKIAACFSVFITDPSEDAIPTAPGAEPSELIDRVEPGMIEHLSAGKQVAFASPPAAEGYEPYIRSTLRSVAAGYGVTYEAMAGDLSNVNFSSGRMGWLEFYRRVVSFQFNTVVPRMCDGVWDWFFEAAIISGLLSKNDRCLAKWTPPRREMIDPAKEIKALREEVRSGFKSWPEAVIENGYDPQNVFEQMLEWHNKFKDAGLMPESDGFFDPTRVAPGTEAAKTPKA